ncbi:MAG: tRNA (guanosine(37)-N1)-methyltransferase TrmD [Cyanobacteria bacterium SZAS TMP-1]|nr:tRNA (guanosine(37)-N1)-methyltransferase TrmD [Cyanobacteria bacterium SZAS TMP-1]
MPDEISAEDAQNTDKQAENEGQATEGAALTFHVVTLFPETIELYCRTSIIGRGIKAGRLAVKSYSPRDFALDKYRKVDDTPYGGGAGMVLKPEPMFACVESIKRPPQSPVLLMTPQGRPFDQSLAAQLSAETDITFICGHYEGFDDRIRSLATMEVSLGDYVLTGGELPALTIIDAVGRLIPGVLGKMVSLAHESFNDGLLEGPQYTKPAEFRGMVVPDVLRSGDHQAVDRWRRERALEETFRNRPDLLEKAPLSKNDKEFLAKLKKQL